MAWNVTTWADAPANPDGVPAAWPFDAQPVEDNSTIPDPPAVQMSDDDYTAYLALHQADYLAWWTAKAAKDAVPRLIEAYKARVILSQTASTVNAGKTCLDDTTALVATLPLADQIAWNNAATFTRASPLLNALAAQIGLTQDQVDGLFVAAARIIV